MESVLDRQSFLGENSVQILTNATVAVVGLGGGGSHVAQQLAHLGFGNFILIDPDKIELPNLNRTVWAPNRSSSRPARRAARLTM